MEVGGQQKSLAGVLEVEAEALLFLCRSNELHDLGVQLAAYRQQNTCSILTKQLTHDARMLADDRATANWNAVHANTL